MKTAARAGHSKCERCGSIASSMVSQSSLRLSHMVSQGSRTAWRFRTGNVLPSDGLRSLAEWAVEWRPKIERCHARVLAQTRAQACAGEYSSAMDAMDHPHLRRRDDLLAWPAVVHRIAV